MSQIALVPLSWLYSVAIGENQLALACVAQSRPSNDKAKPELVPVIWLVSGLPHTLCVASEVVWETKTVLCWAAGRCALLMRATLSFKKNRLRLEIRLKDFCLAGAFYCDSADNRDQHRSKVDWIGFWGS